MRKVSSGNWKATRVTAAVLFLIICGSTNGRAEDSYYGGNGAGCLDHPTLSLSINRALLECQRALGDPYMQKPESKTGVYFAFGQLYHFDHQYDRAIDYYTKAIGWWKDSPEIFRARGDAYAALGNADLAKADYDQAMRLRTGSAEASASRCWLRAIRGGPYDLALKDCDEALKEHPDDWAALDSRCFVHFRKGEDVAAIADCDAALKTKPRLASSLYIRGLAKVRAGNSANGAMDIAAAKDADNRVADTYALYGVTP